MIHDRVHRGWYCYKCGGPHPSHQCQAGRPASELPLETPSCNGPYQGAVPVRVLPFGVMGNPYGDISKPLHRVSAGQVSHRLAVANSLNCKLCGKRVPKKAKIHKYCSRICQQRDGYAKANAKRLKKPRKTKWG